MPATLLIVEDAVITRQMLLDFATAEGWHCRFASSVSDAMPLLQTEAFDCLLIDLRLPDGSGFSVLDAANRCQPLTPKVLMSAYSDIDDALRGLRLGAYDFLRKPFQSLEEVACVIRRALEHRRLLLESENQRRSLEDLNARLAALNAQLDEEVRRRTEELAKANQELRTLDAMKNNLLANISHELRTPLVSVRGYTELFLSGRICPLTEEARKYLQVCLRNIDRLISLIDSLIKYAELVRNSDIKLTLERVDLCALAEEIAVEAKPLADEAQVAIAVHRPAEALLAEADRRLLREAWRELVINAIRFNQPQGKVEVRVDKLGPSMAKISVKDSGIGIPLEEQQRIFERFYQIDAGPTRRRRGMGLGLAIARDNLRLQGAEIMVSSQPGKGSIFHFSFPLARQ